MKGKEAGKTTYYCMPLGDGEELENYGSVAGTAERAGRWLENDDYPTSGRRSSGYAYVMELISEKRFETVLWLKRNAELFRPVRLGKGETFRHEGRIWMKRFEEEHWTEVWRGANVIDEPVRVSR